MVFLPKGNFRCNSALTVPANVRIKGEKNNSNLSTHFPGWTNLIIGSNSMTALFSITGKDVTVGGFTVTAANTGCCVPVVSAIAHARIQLEVHCRHGHRRDLLGLQQPQPDRAHQLLRP